MNCHDDDDWRDSVENTPSPHHRQLENVADNGLFARMNVDNDNDDIFR